MTDLFFFLTADEKSRQTVAPIDEATAKYIIALEQQVLALEKNRGAVLPQIQALNLVRQTCPAWWPRLGDEVQTHGGTVGGIVYKREGTRVSFRDELNNYTMSIMDVQVIKRAA